MRETDRRTPESAKRRSGQPQRPPALRSAAGAQVQPLDFNSLFGALTGNGQTRQPRVIQLNVGQRQLEQVMVDIINGRVANA
jgi:hypothetical protein